MHRTRTAALDSPEPLSNKILDSAPCVLAVFNHERSRGAINAYLSTTDTMAEQAA
jgi:hypothetical protein